MGVEEPCPSRMGEASPFSPLGRAKTTRAPFRCGMPTASDRAPSCLADEQVYLETDREIGRSTLAPAAVSATPVPAAFSDAVNSGWAKIGRITTAMAVTIPAIRGQLNGLRSMVSLCAFGSDMTGSAINRR